MIKKINILTSHYATCDMDCFCFDSREPGARVRPRGSLWRSEAERDQFYADQNKSRVYPDELIPDEAKGRKGKWIVTIEFEPEES